MFVVQNVDFGNTPSSFPSFALVIACIIRWRSNGYHPHIHSRYPKCHHRSRFRYKLRCWFQGCKEVWIKNDWGGIKLQTNIYAPSCELNCRRWWQFPLTKCIYPGNHSETDQLALSQQRIVRVPHRCHSRQPTCSGESNAYQSRTWISQCFFFRSSVSCGLISAAMNLTGSSSMGSPYFMRSFYVFGSDTLQGRKFLVDMHQRVQPGCYA